MSIFRAVVGERVRMFLADGRLSAAITALVLVVAVLIVGLRVEPLLAGVLLALGYPAILMAAVVLMPIESQQE